MVNGQLVVKSDLGGHTFPAEHLTDEEFPKSGEFDCVLAIRPEQIIISTEPVEGAIPVSIYANQPAGSETITTLKAGTMNSWPRRSVRSPTIWTGRSGPSSTRTRSTSTIRKPLV